MKILLNQNYPDDRTAPIETKLPTSKISTFKLLQKVAVHHDASTGTQPKKDNENACDQWTVQTGAVSVEVKKILCGPSLVEIVKQKSHKKIMIASICSLPDLKGFKEETKTKRGMLEMP